MSKPAYSNMIPTKIKIIIKLGQTCHLNFPDSHSNFLCLVQSKRLKQVKRNAPISFLSGSSPWPKRIICSERKKPPMKYDLLKILIAQDRGRSTLFCFLSPQEDFVQYEQCQNVYEWNTMCLVRVEMITRRDFLWKIRNFPEVMRSPAKISTEFQLMLIHNASEEPESLFLPRSL